MIRAAAPIEGGGTLMIFGITPENVRRMRAGKPIHVDGATMGVPGVVVVICFGETERHIVAQMRAEGVQMPPDAEASLAAVEAEHRRKGTTP